ncbi:protein disulfide oxidoreductase [Vibrio lamellibrachiae]|uniref:protein disulfide oxidoreductase n=1 Tax=Vibrio lamellibrachiae TaxID=2910253 RepID=UPI003D0A529A
MNTKMTKDKETKASKPKKKRTWKYWLKEVLMYVVVITVVSIGVDYWRAQDMPNDVPSPIQALSLDGEYIDVIEMSKEKPVVVYFWATWCGACKFVTPTINRLGDSYHVVGISGTSGEDRRVSRYLEAHGYDFSNINDNRNSIFREWGVTVTPTIVIIRNGEVKSITTGITTPPGLYARLWLAR